MRSIVIGIVAVVTSTTFLFFTGRPDGFFHVYFLNVGQGDSILMQTPEGTHILIDGGPGKTVISELGEVLPYFNRRLDYIILTHSDRDHLEGLLSVLKQYDVGTVIFSGVYKKDYLSKTFLRLIHDKKIKLVVADDDDDIFLSDGVTLDILFPFEPRVEIKKIANNDSVILKAVYGAHEILFTGDAETPEEEKLLKRGVNLDADILKVAHHGSKTSSIEAFLKAVMPEYSVISVGKNNSYHHPHPTVLERLKNFHTKILRTDLQGRIEFIFDKKSVREIRTEW